MDYALLRPFQKVAVLFSSAYACVADEEYRMIREKYPDKKIYMILVTKSILCAAKTDNYESYVVIGIECPLHKYENAIYYKIPIPEAYKMLSESHTGGPVFVDSIYDYKNRIDKSGKDPLIITESQDVVDYYGTLYDDITLAPASLAAPSRVEFLMKENVAGGKIENSKSFGVIYTSKRFEELAQRIVDDISSKARAYRIFLKDISYERLISIDTIDCIVLVDCPLFRCKVRTHIPIVSPFSINVWLGGSWSNVSENKATFPGTSSCISKHSVASALLQKKSFKGVPYAGDVRKEETKIEEGKRGLPMRYDNDPTLG